MNRSTPGLPVHHHLPEFAQTHVHRVGDAIQPSHPLSSPSPPAPDPSQQQSLFQWLNSSHEVAKPLGASLVAQLVKNSPAVRETWVQSLGWEDPPEKGMAGHCSIPVRVPWTEEPGGLHSSWGCRVGHDWATFTSLITLKIYQKMGFVALNDIVKDQLLSLLPIMSAPPKQVGCQQFPQVHASLSQKKTTTPRKPSLSQALVWTESHIHFWINIHGQDIGLC